VQPQHHAVAGDGAPMLLFGVFPTFVHRRYHSFPVTSCATKKTPPCTAQRHYVGPNTSMCDSIPTFEAERQHVRPAPTSQTQRQRVGPNTSISSQTPACTAQYPCIQLNASVYDPTPTCRAHNFRFEPNAGIYNPTPTYAAQRQRVGPILANCRRRVSGGNPVALT
jgi:hypothetical protein